MRFLLPLTGAPELVAFPADVRRTLVHRALSALNSDSKVAIWLGIALPVGCGILGVFAAFLLMGYYSGGRPKPELIRIGLEANLSGGPIGCAVGLLVWQHARALMLRPYLQKVIEEYQKTVK